jgi:methionyl-tRNA formyltransferase
LLECLTSWLAGEIVPREQNESEATYTRRMSKDDGRLDWTKCAEQLERMVRAYNPWPTAYTFWKGRQLKVLRARRDEGEGEPGRVLGMSDGRLRVGTGAGILEIVEAQLAGSRAMAASDLVRGHHELLDAVLGAVA